MKHDTKKVFLAAGLLSIVPLAGCGGSSGSSSPNLITPQPRSVSATSANGLSAMLSENADAIGQNGSLTLTITLTNPTAQSVSLALPQDCAPVDPRFPDSFVTITNSAGNSVYPGPGPIGPPCHPVPAAVQTLAPGQTLTATNKLSGVLNAGLFNTKGVYQINTRIVTSSTDAVVVGPLTLTVQ